MKMKKIVTLCLLLGTMFAMTGCNATDVVINMGEDGKPTAQCKEFYEDSQIRTNNKSEEERKNILNEFYNQYNFDGVTYYRDKIQPEDELRIVKSDFDYMTGDVLRVKEPYKYMQSYMKMTNGHINILDHKITVKMNGPVVETNGIIDSQNPNIVVFDNIESLSEAYAYTEIGKKEINEKPTISLKEKKKYYIDTPEFVINTGKYTNPNLYETFINGKKISLEYNYNFLKYVKDGKNSIYIVNEYGLKSDTIEFKFDRLKIKKVGYMLFTIQTKAGLKSLKTNNGKKKINIKKLKHKGDKYYISGFKIEKNLDIVTKSGIKERYEFEEVIRVNGNPKKH